VAPVCPPAPLTQFTLLRTFPKIRKNLSRRTRLSTKNRHIFYTPLSRCRESDKLSQVGFRCAAIPRHVKVKAASRSSATHELIDFVGSVGKLQLTIGLGRATLRSRCGSCRFRHGTREWRQRDSLVLVIHQRPVRGARIA
jgi:hypothetical protein